MSSHKVRTELLTCRYSKENYKQTIPMAINKLIQLFYDKYFYWKIQKDTINEFPKIKNGDEIHCKSTFKIKDIEFECTLCPNGWQQHLSGYVQFFVAKMANWSICD